MELSSVFSIFAAGFLSGLGFFVIGRLIGSLWDASAVFFK